MSAEQATPTALANRPLFTTNPSGGAGAAVVTLHGMADENGGQTGITSNPVKTLDPNNAPYTDFALLTADDTAGHNVPVGRSVQVECTGAGNVSLKLVNGKSKIWPVLVGHQVIPWAAIGLNTTGTTATAVCTNLY